MTPNTIGALICVYCWIGIAFSFAHKDARKLNDIIAPAVLFWPIYITHYIFVALINAGTTK